MATTRATPNHKPQAHKGDGPAKTGAAGKKGAQPPAKEAAAPAPAVPKAPKEVVSLIDEKQKPARNRSAEREKSGLPPIGARLRPITATGVHTAPAPEPEAAVSQPAAAPEPAPAAVETVDAAEAENPASDEKIIHIKPPIIIKELATQLGLRPPQIMKDLIDLGIFANINQSIEPDVAAAVCKKHGFTFEKEKREKGAGVHKVEVVVQAPKPPEKPREEELKNRAPIVTFMGHVDHGKTSLMDHIRQSRVAAGEAGGITQHIGAYRVDYKGQHITFLDTPGHEAFTAMRARGATVTDIVVLVVAADDGPMPQTLEALAHARAAKVPIIVAINKIDLPSANVDKVKGQLQEKGLVAEDWGGDVIMCPVSALKGTGIEHLLEMILLQAEVLELKASPTAPPRGTVIEAQIEPGRGPTATIIVRMGTLKVSQAFICGHFSGKVKSLIDDKGQQIKEAAPSTPVKVLGFAGLPSAGDELLVMENERDAKILSEERLDAQRKVKLATPARPTLENIFDTLAAGQHPVLRMVLKCDVQGSMEALLHSLGNIKSKKIDLDMIHAAVGPVTESDILLASASNAVVIGFNIKVENSAAGAAKREGVQIKLFSIIYELIDQVKDAMAGLLEPEVRESVIGHAEVKKVFDLSRGKVAGCLVTDGRIARSARARVTRGRQPIYDGGLSTLRRFEDDVKEVRNGLECGIKLGDFNEYEVGDVIECYNLEKFPQKL
ncbi:MAG TPA: translation initiation factor IF-2 [Chthoniobacteraceae bacterium]|jgi:translation initiation factor IF-2|nr:translation initiation factor IF-2 [Chthoniobacteraceae bacterium]